MLVMKTTAAKQQQQVTELQMKVTEAVTEQ